jgi:hypothetical protein
MIRATAADRAGDAVSSGRRASTAITATAACGNGKAEKYCQKEFNCSHDNSPSHFNELEKSGATQTITAPR